jgi:enamine deaminase RidA (YjgF/YER057c/UK114 family)
VRFRVIRGAPFPPSRLPAFPKAPSQFRSSPQSTPRTIGVDFGRSLAPLFHNSPETVMAESIDARLEALEIDLPTPAKPVANFVPCVRSGDLLFVSGQVSSWNGEIRYRGKVGGDVSIEDARTAARLCGLNVLAQAKSFLGSLDRVRRVILVQGFVNAVPEFTDHPTVINGASDLFVELFGDQGRHARFAVGSGSLPFHVAVEVAAVLEVE